MDTQRRALGVIRLSKLTDETTSPQRQRQIIMDKAAERGATVTAWAEDTDVSATKYRPTERPELAAMLRRHSEYDEVLFWRLDRFVRDPADLTDMIRWANRHGKGLLSATESFDLSTVDDSPMDEGMAYLLACFAKSESKATSTRVKGAHKYLRENGRFVGGNVPYGYRAIRNAAGAGWVLVIDDETAAFAREAVSRAVNGESANSIAADFNRRGIVSPRDHARIAKGAAARGGPWHRETVKKILRSESLLGRALHNRASITGPDGMPILRAEPLIDPGTWRALQAALDRASITLRRTHTSSALLNVGYCGCGQSLYKWSKANQQGRIYSYYRCKDNYRRLDDPARCSAKPIPCAILDDVVHGALLAEVGDSRLEEVTVIPGDGHETELAAVGQQIADLTTERFVRKVLRPDFASAMASLEAEYARLDGLERTPDRVERTLTRVTFAGHWDGMTGPARRLWLRDNGVRVEVASDPTAGGPDYGIELSPVPALGEPIAAGSFVAVSRTHGLRIIVRLGDLEYLRGAARRAA